jgi:putative FmdB family regulatory protein
MPIFEYKPSGKNECEFCSNGFEMLRKTSDEPLAACPKCGAEIVKILSAPSLAKSAPSLNPTNLEAHGFTQYRKSGKGVYEKTAGKGPGVISSDSE